MAAADRHSGKAVHLSYTPNGGSAIDLDADYRSLDWNQELNEIDATAGDDDWEYFLDSFKRGTFAITILAGVTTTYLVPGSFGSLIYGPEGSTAGLRQVTLPVKLMKANEKAGYADVITLDLEFRVTGDVTVGTFSA
jgi:hypothetical protein